MNCRALVSCIFLFTAATGVANAGSVPHTFTNGGVIDANAVNENFVAVAPPVGTVIMSLLTEAQFQTESGSDWVLADGRDVTGSAYATLTGNTVLPDLRGVFLRGKNNGRNDGNENPDGDLALGAYQADEVKSHGHGVSDPGHNHGYTENAQWLKYYYWVNQSPATSQTGSEFTGRAGTTTSAFTGISIQNAGGAESRPRNVTINYFIKIN